MVRYTIARKPPQARYLPKRHALKALAKNGNATLSETPDLENGQEQLYSFSEPSMAVGDHQIQTTQTIKIPDDTKTQPIVLTDAQDFTVVVPRYKLPESAVHVVYPPQGHTDNVEILPHIVLNDPQLPWARAAVNKVDTQARNRVPWLAMLVFRQEELAYAKHTEDQSNTKAVTLSLGKLRDLVKATGSDCTTPVLKPGGALYDGDAENTEADFIFVPKNLFNSFFKDTVYPGSQTKCDVSRYQWLAHTRSINTSGMANSGMDGEHAEFGVVISQRAGALGITQPTDLVVHLVSIEHVWDMSYPIQSDRVALCSLESWSYTCLPPNSFNVDDAFRHIGSTFDVLRIDTKLLTDALPGGQELPERLKRRVEEGYVLTRYRTQTGEETAAWMRGPLAPVIVEHNDTQDISTNGQDLQTMDKDTGIMDIAYSCAWQLGRVLAVGDQGFVTALSSLSINISRLSMEETKKSLLRDQGAFQDKRDTLRQLADSLKTLRRLHEPDGLRTGPDARWRPQPSVSVSMSRQAPHVKRRYGDHLSQIIRRLTRSQGSEDAYDEIRGPASSDWMVVCSWILDRMYLAGVPAHYLIPDPAYLPEESLRFFHIDRNWIEAMVDGALSVANHLPNDKDIRAGLKDSLNRYMNTHPEGLHYSPQLPSYGFLLRSHLCVRFPDLVVEAYRAGSDVPDPTVIVRQENIAEGVLLVMFDARPGNYRFVKLILREPPHQQAFACGRELTRDSVTVDFKKIYTIPLEEQAKEKDRSKPIESITFTAGESDIFIWQDEGVDVSTLQLPAYAEKTHQLLLVDMKSKYAETDPTATLLGIQLNAPMRYLEMEMAHGIIRQSADNDNDDDDGKLTGFRMLKIDRDHDDNDGASKSDAPPIDWDAPFRSKPASVPEPPTPTPPGASPTPQPTPPVLPAASSPDVRADSGIDRLLSCSIYPLSHAGLANGVQELRVRQDLVFRMTAYGYGDSDKWQLRRVELSMPYGTPTEERPTLLDRFSAPGPTMMADFRFNVASTVRDEAGDGKRTYHLTIVPRAPWVYMKDVENLSVLLRGMRVANYDDLYYLSEPPVVPVSVTETYEDHVRQTTVQVKITLR